jgi:hypothetical protein
VFLNVKKPTGMPYLKIINASQGSIQKYEDLKRTFFFVIKPTRCTNFTNLFCHETLHVSDSSSVHHQEFIHCTLSNGIRHAGL